VNDAFLRTYPILARKLRPFMEIQEHEGIKALLWIDPVQDEKKSIT
jgi:hypothetical protein